MHRGRETKIEETTAVESEALWQVDLTKVINREISEVPGTRRPHRQVGSAQQHAMELIIKLYDNS
jgi:hypothetical protein